MKKLILVASFICAISFVKETKPVIGEALAGFAFGSVCGFLPPLWPGAAFAIPMMADSGTAAAGVALTAASLGFVIGAVAFCAVTGLVIYYLFKPTQKIVSHSFNSAGSNVHANHLSITQQKNLSWRQVRQSRLNLQPQTI